MIIELESHFQRGGEVIALEGEFPSFVSHSLAYAGECTRNDDADQSCSVQVDEADPRPIFKTVFWGVSSLSYESSATPLNRAAVALCAQPLPKGWGITLQGVNLGGASGRDSFQTEGTLKGFVCDLVAGRHPAAHSPAERRAKYMERRTTSIAKWEAAGLDGRKIWDAHVQWATEQGVIELASKLALRCMGPSRGFRDFQELNGFRSPLSHPRTQSAERMARLTCSL